MKHNNIKTLKEGIMKQLERRFDEIQVQLIQYCDQIVEQAIKFRLEEPEKHDFTGNLINSFVAILYRDGHAVYYATSCGNVKLPVRVKMTKTGKWTHVAPDYEGLPHTRYNAEIPTNRGLGQEDARKFLEKFKPNKKAKFSIVCAYTTEYASFVEELRGTTGMMELHDWVSITAVKAITGKH